MLVVAVAVTPALGAKSYGSDKATADEAGKFVEEAEKELEEVWIRSSRASWIQSNFITGDTERLAAEMQEAAIALTTKYALEAARFDGLELPADLARKLKLLKLSLSMPAPNNDAERAELTEIAASMESTYGKGKYCPKDKADECLDLTEMSRILAESRDPDQLLDIWRGWRKISPPMRDSYARFVALSNKGARELGFPDVGVMWRSNYDMPADAFAAEVERLWEQVKPLYLALHAHVRASLAAKYGADLVPQEGRIPAHLLGNMWSQTWTNIYPLVAPPEGDAGYDLTKILKSRKLDEREMVRYGERFFTSLGFEPLPQSQDVHPDQRRGLLDHPSRAGAQHLPAGLPAPIAPVSGERQRRVPRGGRRHHLPLRDARILEADRSTQTGSGGRGGPRASDEDGARQGRVPAIRASRRPVALEGLRGGDRAGRLQRVVVGAAPPLSGDRAAGAPHGA
jgi:hypothetical protein